MATAVASAPNHTHPKRPPLLPSDSDNAPTRRRPKGREVTSRYLSLSSSSSNSSSSTNTTLSSATPSVSSRRSRSPMTLAGTATPKTQQRAASAERRRPAAGAERMLVTSMRSLSVSFQGESYSVPVSKVKPPPAMAAATPKAAPERRKAGVTPGRERGRENSRPTDQQHRWPGRLRGENSSLLSRSLDYGAERVKLVGSSSEVKELRKFMGDENSREKVRAELKFENNNVEVGGIRELDSRLRAGDSSNSDVESVSLGRNASGYGIQLRGGGPLGVVVPARSWQEPASPLPNSGLNRKIGPSKLIFAKKFQNDSPVSSPLEVCLSRGLSPIRGGARAASPCKALTSATSAPLRGVASPSRVTNGTGNLINDNNTCSTPSTPSMFSFAVDVRRAKLGENRIADAHDLRMLYNWLLQWRLANARVADTMLVQKHTAERSLYNAWVTTSKLRHSVRSKGIELQSLRHNLKLYSILKKQEPHLENWGLLDGDHCNSVSGAIKALEASTIRLPIVGGAQADVHKVQEAISSAVDVMQAMASSVCSLLVKVEQMNSLMSELSNLTTREHRLLDECKDYLSKTFIPLQVMHCSLRTQVMQVQCVQTSLAKKV